MRAGEPLENIATLVGELRVRNPRLKDPDIKQGVMLFLTRQFADHAARLARRQRLRFHASLAPIPARPGLLGAGGSRRNQASERRPSEKSASAGDAQGVGDAGGVCRLREKGIQPL